MAGHLLNAAKWAIAVCGLLLSPIALGAAMFAAYFVIDGARNLGSPAASSIFGVVIVATLLFRRRKAKLRSEAI
ncbi:MAG TPA: hypothetical protein VET89_03465 [Stellaceae bacterium]|nr:hypothetical protein [Stellaceae bacterium]